MADHRQIEHDIDYLAHAFPVLVAYTTNIALVDIDRLCDLVEDDPENSPRRQFLAAMRDFINAVAEIDGLEGLDV